MATSGVLLRKAVGEPRSWKVYSGVSEIIPAKVRRCCGVALHVGTMSFRRKTSSRCVVVGPAAGARDRPHNLSQVNPR